MAIYKSDIVDINLDSGSIHRSYLNHTIGSGDNSANRFGVRTFRNGLAEDLTGASCQAIFMNAAGTNIALTSYGTVSGNEAYVTLPQACYNVEGQFTLAIKLVKSGETVTTRIVDGVVCNTGTTGAVAPTSSVPTYQEILDVYAAMQSATSAANTAIAETFDATKAYPAGKYVINSGALYRLTADHAANVTWANTSKVAANFGDELTATKSALNAIECPSQNLFALAGFKKNYVLSTSDGTTETYNAASGHTIEYTALEKDKKYSMSAPEDTNVRIFYYNSSKVKTDTAVVNAKTFTYTPTADMYVRFQCTNEIAESGNVQFEEGERSAYIGEKSAVDSIIRKNFNQDKQEKDAKISDIDSIIARGVFYSVADASLAGNGWVNKSNGQLTTNPAYSYKYKKLIVDSMHLYYIRSATISGSAAAMLNYYNSSDEYLGYEYDSSTGSAVEYSNILITPPENTAYIIVVAVGDFSVYTNMTNQTYWTGKKILWLGTSIPATAFNGGQAYPQIVGANIGATVRNNALSGSFARRRFDPEHIDDPSMTNIDMNWGMRSLSTSEDEIDDIATNWSTYKSHFANAPDTLSAETIAQWKAWSYETLLDPYISESDLIVFDMGRNDYASVMNDPEAPFDKFYFVGAMDFLIKRIYETNPRKRICMIAHYENQDHGSDLFSKIVENQIIVSNFWSIPIFRLDKMLGWSNKSITTYHDWVQHGSNWVFEETEDAHTMPVYHAWLEDNLHPYVDSTGEATYLIANAITQWIKTIV